MITDLGFIRPSLAELEAQVQQNFVSKFSDSGENNPDLEPESFLGALSSIIAALKDELYQVAENTYYSLFLTTASGVALDRISAATVRIPAQSAQTLVDLEGVPTTLIPDNFIFETEDGVQYRTTSNITLDGSGLGSALVSAVVSGVGGNAPIGAIRYIPVPLAGLDTVTNPAPATGGSAIETDSSFRSRSIANRSADRTSSLPAIENRIKEVAGVLSVIGFENTDELVVGGRPPHSIEMVVRGGADQDIGNVIFATKAAGIETFGSITVIVIDTAGDPKEIKFSRLTQVSIRVIVNLTINATYSPVTAPDLIRQAILNYIGGVNPALQESAGVEPAEDVYAWKAAGAIFELNDVGAIPGIETVEVLLAITPAIPSLPKISIAGTEEAFTDFSLITVND